MIRCALRSAATSRALQERRRCTLVYAMGVRKLAGGCSVCGGPEPSLRLGFFGEALKDRDAVVGGGLRASSRSSNAPTVSRSELSSADLP